MKYLYVIVMMFWWGVGANAQTPGWEWAESPLGEGEPYSVCTDANGYFYVTGLFFDTTIIFGNTILRNKDTTGNGDVVFVAKYDSLGNVIWAKSPWGFGAGYGISTDAGGNVYVTGQFLLDTIVFGNDTLISTGANAGGESIFTVKYDGSGNVIWAKSAGGRGYWSPSYNTISTDAVGNSYITGGFLSPIIIFGNDTLINSKSGNLFTVKYDPEGNVVWAKCAGDTGEIMGTGVISLPNGGCCVTGTISTAPVVLGNDTLTQAGIFTAKYNASGNVVWAKTIECYGNAAWSNVITDLNGNVFITGDASNYTIVFGNDTLANQYSVYTDFFIGKYDSSGNALWAKTTGGTGAAAVSSSSIDADGNVYVLCSYHGTNITFGGDTLINPDITGGNWNLAIVKYNASGDVIWIKSDVILEELDAGAISTTASGISYISGPYWVSTLTFGNTTLTNITGASNIFIAKLGNQLSTTISTITPSSNTILVFPNPSTSTFNFSGVTPGSTIQVYNVLGEMIYSSIANSDNYRVTLNSQAKGIYFYRVSENGNDIQQGKIVLE